MNIGIITTYGVYDNDRLFDSNACKIGENLLTPNIILKKELENKGVSFHTADIFSENKIDKYLFQDISGWYWAANSSLENRIKYIIKRKWRKDYLRKAERCSEMKQRILILQEPPVINPYSYKKKIHEKFGTILTWDDSLVDGKKYLKFYYPQVMPSMHYEIEFSKKKMITMICGNKISKESHELYSARRQVIDYFEKENKYEFDLYGFGWETEKIRNYKGRIEKKLETLAQYKYAICYENMNGVNGYITEKIFDCFFAGVVPIYLGAENIEEYVPSKAFIDRRRFKSMDEIMDCLLSISEQSYQEYISAAQEYLQGNRYEETFSVNAYVKRMCKVLLG